MKSNKPSETEYHSFYESYIKRVDADDILAYLEKQNEDIVSFLKNFPRDKHDFAYAEGKWTVKELLRHIIDMERIFGYRALTVARKDSIELPGFDENDYVLSSDDSHLSFEALVLEYDLLRRSNLIQFKNFSQRMFLEKGSANGGVVSVRAIIFIIAGHLEHHKTIIKERYL